MVFSKKKVFTSGSTLVTVFSSRKSRCSPKKKVLTSVSTPVTVFSSSKSRCSLKKKVFTPDSTSINVQFYSFSRLTKISFATHQWVTTHSLRTAVLVHSTLLNRSLACLCLAVVKSDLNLIAFSENSLIIWLYVT